jgi:hypothetical protein
MVNGVLAWGWGGGVVAGAGLADEGVDGAGGLVGQGSPDGDLVHVFVVEGLDVEGVDEGFFDPVRGVGEGCGGVG